MEFKINTKEKFHVITLPGTALSATMTEELSDCLLNYLQTDACLPDRQVKNIILDLRPIQSLDNIAAETLVKVQQKFYENNVSFVMFGLQPQVEEFLDKDDLLEMMNIAPTESEASDIVQMEEIEREMLDEEGF
jgi:anti-anti-sigma factor